MRCDLGKIKVVDIDTSKLVASNDYFYVKESEETEVKSKEELIEKWESAIESAEFYGKGREGELIGYMKDFVRDLSQLEEPETLSENWIGQKSIDTHVDTLNGEVQVTFRLDDLQDVLVPKQEEVKVSKMWHDVIVQNKEDGHSLRWTLNYIDNLNVNDVDSFAKAWIAYPNIEVEEEQKYNVKFKVKTPYGTVSMFLYKKHDVVLAGDNFEDYYPKEDKYRLTEQEIKDYDEKLWAFAIKVEEVEG